MTKNKTTAKAKGPTGATTNKSEFVRNLPTNMPAKDVVARAKAAGLTLSIAYVYSIRTASKARARKAGGTAAPQARRGRPSAASKASSGSSGNGRVEELLRAVAAELGLSRAIGLLQAEQQKVRAVMGG